MIMTILKTVLRIKYTLSREASYFLAPALRPFVITTDGSWNNTCLADIYTLEEGGAPWAVQLFQLHFTQHQNKGMKGCMGAVGSSPV